MDLENTVASEEARHSKTCTYHVTPLLLSRTASTAETGSGLGVARSWGWGATADGSLSRLLFRVMMIFWN